MPYILSQKQKTYIKNNLEIVYAANEQVVNHLTDWYEKNNIKVKPLKSMAIGDWSFRLDKMPEFGIYQKWWGFNDCLVERKNSINELSGNFSDKTKRANWEKNQTRGALKVKRFIVVIEEENGYSKIARGEYDTGYPPKTFITSLHSVYIKYNIPFIFVSKKAIAHFMLNFFLNYIYLKIEDRIYKL